MKKASSVFEVIVNGLKVLQELTLTGDNAVSTNPTLLAAITGVLTTRTGNQAGVVTVASGHGITTDDTIGIGWYADGVWNLVYNADVTGVTATTITFATGSGDSLPAQATTDLRISKRNVETFSTGDIAVEAVKAMGVAGTAECGAVVYDTLGGESALKTITPTNGFLYINGLLRGHGGAPQSLQEILTVTADTPLASIHWYNFSTSANKVRAEALFD